MDELLIECLFHRGQLLHHVNTSRVYEVLKTPASCVVNSVLSYQLEQIDLTVKERRMVKHRVVFFRSQKDVELYWEAKNKEVASHV